MGAVGFPFPVLAGKEDRLRLSLQEVRARKTEYEESRLRAGVTMERVWLQRNPDGSSLIVVYVESGGEFGDIAEAFLHGSDFDRWFIEVNSEITGIDLNQIGNGPTPETIGAWFDSGAARGTGLAFTVPLMPDKADAARAFCKEAYENRREEFAASRRAQSVTREVVSLMPTPMGDFITVYGEGDDPWRANQGFADSQEPYDRWFKDQLKTMFPPMIDFDQPVPANEQLWDYQR